MAEFLINVKSKWDTTSINAYVAQVEKAISRIKAATERAQSAKGGQGRPANVAEQASLQGEYLRNEANIRTLHQDKSLPPAEKASAIQIAETNRKAFQLQAQAAGVTLLTGKARSRAVNEILTINRQADANEKATAEERLKNSKKRTRTPKPPLEAPDAEEQAKRDAEKLKPKPPSVTAAREKRVQDEKEQKLRGQERERLRQNAAGAAHTDFDPDLTYAERQRILAPGIKEYDREKARSAGKKGGLKGDIQYNREAIDPETEIGGLMREAAELQARTNAIKFRIQQAVTQQLRLTEEAVKLTAQEVASAARFSGNVNRLLAAQNQAINTFAHSKNEANKKNEKINTRVGQIEDDALRPRGPQIDPRSGKRIPPPPGSPDAIAREEARIAADVRRIGVSARRTARSWGAIAEDAAALEEQDTAGRNRSYAKSQAAAPRLQAEVEGKQFRQMEASRAKAQKDLDRALPNTPAGQAGNRVGDILGDSARTNTRRQRAGEAAAKAAETVAAESAANDKRILRANRGIAKFKENAERAAKKEAEEAAKTAQEARKQAETAARQNAPASWFQRAEAKLRPGGAPPSERPTLGQAVGAGIFSAARFGAGAAVLYGTLNTVKEMVKESSDLERVFNQIQRQFEATGKAADFSNFRHEIIEISKDTGQMATEVAFVGFQFQAAFGDGPGGAAYALEQTRAAIEIAKVTGLDLNELVDSLTASSISFGVSISDVGDKALGIQERFGVQAKETLQFFGDLSSVAADAGLNLDQLGAIAGTVQQATGKSGTALAEGLGRIIPGIQEASVALVRFYQQTPALAGKVPELAAAAGQGQTGAVLERLIRDYHLLDESQKKQVITLLGGRREAQVLIPILENSAKVVRELDGQLSGLDAVYNDSGKSAKYFADLQKTLSQRMSELAREFEAFGQKLFEAGLGDVLKDILKIGGLLLQVISLLAKGMSAFNVATGGAAIKVVELLVGMKLLAAFGTKVNLGKLLLGTVAAGPRQPGGPALPRSGGLIGSIGPSFLGQRYAAGRQAAAVAGGSLPTRPLSGVAGALGVSPVGLAAVGVAVGFEVYQSRTAKLEEAATKFKASLEKTDLQELIRLRESGERKVNFWQKLWINLPGGPTGDPNKALDREIQKKQDAPMIHDFEAANAGGLFKGQGVDPKFIQSAIEAAKGGDKNALENIGLVMDSLRQNRGEALTVAITNFDAEQNQKNTKAKVDDGDFLASVDSADQAFQAGTIGPTEYLKTLTQATDAYTAVLGEAGTWTKKQAEEAAALFKKTAEFTSGKARDLLDYNLSLKDLAGQGGPKAEVAGLTDLLNNKTVTDPKVQLKAAQDLVAAEKHIQDVQLAAADTAKERLDIINAGYKIPDESRIAVLQDAILNVDVGFRAVIDSVSFAFGDSANLAYRVASGAITDGISSMAELKKLITQKMKDLLKLANENGLFDSEDYKANEEYNRLQTQLAGLPSGKGTAVPGATGHASPEDKAAAEKAAATEAHKTAEDTARARLALRKAQAEGDPVAQADIAIEEAKYSESIASTAAEHLNAATQLLEANRAKLAAQSTVADAYLDLDTALAAAAGDSVKVAQNELKGAMRHLEEAKARGDKVGTIAAQADVVAKEAAVADAEIQSKTDDADFLHEMEQISDAQYIAMYKSILNTIPPEQVQKRRQFMLKLHELEKGVADDLNFDIPSEIKLPKLYEVRRLRQTQADGSGYGVGSSYQDNRQIMVQYNVMTPQDNQAALDDLLAVTSGQPRVGSAPRGY